MNVRYLMFFVAALVLNACNWGVAKKPKADITTDTLTYTYKTIKQRATDCGNKPDSSCTVAKINYPLFNGQTALNDTVSYKLVNLFGADDPDTDLQQYTQHFLAGYDAFKKHDSRSAIFFTLDSHAKIIRQDSSLTTLEISGYSFKGGAHGSSITTFINWDTKAGKSINLDDVLTPDYKEKLTAIADTIFRTQEKLSDTASLANDYFFKDGKFALNRNFSITPIGIRFLYNQYEIKPYAAGQTDLFIPYAKIKSLLKPNTVITQYLK
ncbi:RsiV family protein [Mucilaginibacter sp. UR6-11]|uniref:RsiV family protein n=1 Tax=Mucilaginibacter sp. UR6-11 TaxID=1435644 RepID=UPI001E4BCAAE|nr:RsiV family protein [Mucilaginibacter sp. UR6-11]MCC8426264.1 RsiV family protein [Mucilaginibacter sp. UR6-11]